MRRPPITFTAFVALTAALTWVLIALGAAVRVTDAGMSCPDWPLCYGQLFPFPAPEGGYVRLIPHPAGPAGPDFLVERFTMGQVALEWGHRLLAAIVGLMVLATAGWSLVKRPLTRLFAWLAVVALVSQVLLGKVTVLMENVNWSVAAHLGNALVLFALIILTRKAEATPLPSVKPAISRTMKGMLWLLAVLVFGTMIVGGMVSTSHAGGVCGGLPACGEAWWPEDFGQMLHMKHRYMGLAVLLLAIGILVKARREAPVVKAMARGLKILVGVQVVLGIIVLYSFSAYPWAYQALSVAHLAWGSLLFMAAVGALGKIHIGLGGDWHGRK